jgi:hypothetical protein
LAGWQTLIQLESMTLSLPDTGGDVTIEVVMTARRGSKLAATFDVWRAASLTLVGPVGQMDVLIAGRLDGIATEALEFLSFGRMFHARYDEAALRAALRALPRAGATEIAIGMSQGRVHWLAEGAAKDLLEAFTGVQGWLASLSGRKLESRKSAFRHGGFVAEQLTSERAVALSAVRGGRAVGAIGPTEDAARADFRAALDPTRTLAPGRQAIVDAARARGDSLLLIVDNTMLEPAAPGPLLAVSVGRPAAGAFRLRVALAAGPAQRFLRTFLEPNPAVLFAEDAAQQLCACPDVPCARRVVESFQAAYQAKFSRATGTKADLERINRAGQRMTECVGKLSAGPTR